MSAARPLPLEPAIDYPESDGLPMSENSLHFCWIFVLYGNLAALFRDVLNVFVSGNQFWYPVQGHREIVNSPDVYVVFGRPKGHRSSWIQWEEDNVPLTVVFEILSPSNKPAEMADKLHFYTEYGVEEYYLFDPRRNRLDVFLRSGTALLRQRKRKSFESPRLGIRFDLSGDEMVVYYPDGQPFLSFEELKASQEHALERADKAELRADTAEQRADKAEQRASRLVELGRKVRRGLATPDELQELERLEEITSR